MVPRGIPFFFKSLASLPYGIFMSKCPVPYTTFISHRTVTQRHLHCIQLLPTQHIFHTAPLSLE